MENRVYTYIEVKEPEYKKLKKIFNWKKEHLKDYVRFDDYAKRLYINHLEDIPSIIKIILQNDETICIALQMNRDISIESVVGRR